MLFRVVDARENFQNENCWRGGTYMLEDGLKTLAFLRGGKSLDFQTASLHAGVVGAIEMQTIH